MNAKSKRKRVVSAEFLASIGYKISQAAEALGVSASHLARICRGERPSTVELEEAIMRLPRYCPIRPQRRGTVIACEKGGEA